MREHKFRQYDKEKRKFHYWGFTPDGFISPRHDIKESQEFTGLKDKNGKEIYEGDIVKEEGFDGKVVRIKEIKWVSNMNIGAGFNHRDDGKYLKVIGNIYENPELLKEKNG